MIKYVNALTILVIISCSTGARVQYTTKEGRILSTSDLFTNKKIYADTLGLMPYDYVAGQYRAVEYTNGIEYELWLLFEELGWQYVRDVNKEYYYYIYYKIGGQHEER